jgi:large repetitive protein
LSTSLLAVGNHILTAVYSGDANYPTATVETPVSVEVIAAVTSTTLTASTSPQSTTLIANVVVTSPGNPPVVGFISFYDGAALLGSEPVSNGVATLNLATLSPGMHSFKAVFSSNGTFSASEASLVVSTDGPQVTHLLRYGFHWQPTYLLLYFNGPLDPTSAQNPANYQILGPSGHRITVVSAIYDSASHTVTLVPAERLNFHRRYCLTVNGVAPSGLTSPSGFLLDGAGNGHAGSNYVTTITWKNLAGRASKLPTLSLVHTAPPPPAKAQTLPHHTKVTLHSAAEARPRPAKVQMSPHHAKVTLHSAAVDHPLVTNSMHLRGAARR